MGLKENIDSFLSFLSRERGLAENTLAAYGNDLNQFSKFLENERAPDKIPIRERAGKAGGGSDLPKYSESPGAKDSVLAMDKGLIVSFILYLKERGYAPTSVARKVAALRSLFHFLTARGLIAHDPTRSLDTPRVGRSLPRTLSEMEVEKLLAETRRFSLPESLRDRAMLGLLWATGMRVTELVSLDLEDINLYSGYVRCRGRGARQRQVPVGFEAMRDMDDYIHLGRVTILNNRRNGGTTNSQGALFLNHRGERLTRQGFWLIVKNYAKRAGVTQDITPHTLRHSFAAYQIGGGADLRSVQKVLGHASIATTQIYTQLAKGKVREVYNKSHPRA